MTKKFKILSLATGVILGIMANTLSFAATSTLYMDRTAFLTALGPVPLAQQDFEGYADGTNMAGVQFMTGVTATTNLSSIEIFQGSGDKELFIFNRAGQTEAYYDVLLSNPYKAMGFDVDAFNPATPGPGLLDIFFSDGDSRLGIAIFPTNATENNPLFLGVISDTTITRMRWSEGPELGGLCCEETALDNFVAPAAVPVPAAVWLFGSGLLGLIGVARRGTKHGA